MLTKTDIKVNQELLKLAETEKYREEFRTSINRPTGNFFYDPWVISDEYKDTVWEELLSTLPYDIGEARIICLKPGNCYQIHADIDDRYHLNVCGDNAFLIELESATMFKLEADAFWYEMDAGLLHSAANFGRTPRLQLVVRKLLNRSQLQNPISVSLETILESKHHGRFIFDQVLSPWLSKANKRGVINNFAHQDNKVFFEIEAAELESLKNVVPDTFKLTL